MRAWQSSFHFSPRGRIHVLKGCYGETSPHPGTLRLNRALGGMVWHRGPSKKLSSLLITLTESQSQESQDVRGPNPTGFSNFTLSAKKNTVLSISPGYCRYFSIGSEYGRKGDECLHSLKILSILNTQFCNLIFLLKLIFHIFWLQLPHLIFCT